METNENPKFIRESGGEGSQVGFVYLLNSMGRASLIEIIQAASFLFTPSSHWVTGEIRRKDAVREAKQCYAFIAGTGLEVMLDQYCIAYDADEIRRAFREYFKVRPHD